MDESNDASSDRVCIEIRHCEQEARLLKNYLPKMIASNTAGAGNFSASLNLFHWLHRFTDKCDCTFPSLSKYSDWQSKANFSICVHIHWSMSCKCYVTWESLWKQIIYNGKEINCYPSCCNLNVSCFMSFITDQVLKLIPDNRVKTLSFLNKQFKASLHL